METSNPLQPEVISEVDASKINPQREKAQAFVNTLTTWRETDRGRLARLKRNAGEALPGRGVAWFYGVLQEHEIPRWNHENYFLVATLFDLNRYQMESGDLRWRTMGASLRLQIDMTSDSEASKVKAMNRIGRRLQILIDSNYVEGPTSELAFRIRQTVQWLNGQKIGLDYVQLILDLGSWSHEDRFIQKKWARDFYKVTSHIPNIAKD